MNEHCGEHNNNLSDLPDANEHKPILKNEIVSERVEEVKNEDEDADDEITLTETNVAKLDERDIKNESCEETDGVDSAEECDEETEEETDVEDEIKDVDSLIEKSLDFNDDESVSELNENHVENGSELACQSRRSLRVKSVSRNSSKPRAPAPPSASPRRRSSSFTNGTTSKSSAVVRFNKPQPCNFRFLQLSYNTNLKKPPENWLRLRSSSASGGSNRHGHSSKYSSYFWSYPFSRSSSWSLFSSFRYARKKRSKGLSHYASLCLCCGCCNCSHVNQTCCCCCYHCVHTISSCRRADLIKQKALAALAAAQRLTPPETPTSSASASVESVSDSEAKTSRTSSRKGVAPQPKPNEQRGI